VCGECDWEIDKFDYSIFWRYVMTKKIKSAKNKKKNKKKVVRKSAKRKDKDLEKNVKEVDAQLVDDDPTDLEVKGIENQISNALSSSANGKWKAPNLEIVSSKLESLLIDVASGHEHILRDCYSDQVHQRRKYDEKCKRDAQEICQMMHIDWISK